MVLNFRNVVRNRALAASFNARGAIFFTYNQKFLDPCIKSCLMTLQNMVRKISQSGALLFQVLIRVYYLLTRRLQF